MQWSDYWENEGPGLSDVRGKWPGKELVGMNFAGSAGRERGRGGALHGLLGAELGCGECGAPRGLRLGAGVATPAPRSPGRARPARAAWHSSKRAPDCYALCFSSRAEPGGMGLAQAVSLPRGGGTLKAQRPLPAAIAASPTSKPGPSTSPGDLWRSGRSRKPSGGVRHGARARGARAMEPGRHEVRAANAIGRLGRTGRSARRGRGSVRREPGAPQTKDEEEKEAASGRRSVGCQGLPWRILRGLAPLSQLTMAQEGKMGKITTRRSNVSWGVTREDFLAEEALPLAFSGKETALSEIRESAAGWLRMALEAGTTHCDLDTGQALGTDFAKDSSSTSPWQGPLFLTA